MAKSLHFDNTDAVLSEFTNRSQGKTEKGNITVGSVSVVQSASGVEEKAKVGRPRMNDSQKKLNKISLSLTNEDYAKIKEESEILGLSITATVSFVLKRYFNEK